MLIYLVKVEDALKELDVPPDIIKRFRDSNVCTT